MKPDKLWACVFVLLLSTASLAQDKLLINDAYIPAMPPSMQNTAAYFTLHNQGEKAVILTGARTEIAEQVVLHETVAQDGQLRMSRLDSVEIAPGEMLTLENGGMHFMVMGLNSAPAPGDEVNMILEFEDGLELPLILPVRSLLPVDSEEKTHQH